MLFLRTLILFLFTFGNHCDSVYTSPWSLEINLGANVISKFRTLNDTQWHVIYKRSLWELGFHGNVTLSHTFAVRSMMVLKAAI